MGMLAACHRRCHRPRLERRVDAANWPPAYVQHSAVHLSPAGRRAVRPGSISAELPAWGGLWRSWTHHGDPAVVSGWKTDSSA
jgi:hypothetical protein